jgi:hypothetical protein
VRRPIACGFPRHLPPIEHERSEASIRDTSTRDTLAADVTAHLEDMSFMSDERKELIVATACANFDEQTEAAITKIESEFSLPPVELGRSDGYNNHT